MKSLCRLEDSTRPLFTLADAIVNTVVALSMVALCQVSWWAIFGEWSGWGWTAWWFVSAFCGSLISDFYRWQRNRRGTR